MHDTPPDQLGFSNTGPDCSTASGCTVTDTTHQASFGQGFAEAGGGVWAAQFDVAGVLLVSISGSLLCADASYIRSLPYILLSY